MRPPLSYRNAQEESTSIFLLQVWQPATKKPTEVEVVELTNSITEKEKKEGWQLLFDGRSLEQWKGYGLNGELPKTWSAREGEIVGQGKDNLITKEQYDDFDLTLEFNLTEAANSGIFYFVKLF